MFGFIDDMVKTTAKLVEDVVDVSIGVVTLGEYGEVSKENVSRIIASGVTIYALSEASGVAVDILQNALDE